MLLFPQSIKIFYFQLRHLDLSGNPWRCDCGLSHLARAAAAVEERARNDVETAANSEEKKSPLPAQSAQCAAPGGLKGVALTALAPGDLTCDSEAAAAAAAAASDSNRVRHRIEGAEEDESSSTVLTVAVVIVCAAAAFVLAACAAVALFVARSGARERREGGHHHHGRGWWTKAFQSKGGAANNNRSPSSYSSSRYEKFNQKLGIKIFLVLFLPSSDPSGVLPSAPPTTIAVASPPPRSHSPPHPRGRPHRQQYTTR